MDVKLIVARCGAKAALAGDVDSLDRADSAALLDATPGAFLSSTAISVGGRLAVGRRENGRAAWWVVGPSFPLQPPHGIWLAPGLFQPDGDGRVPESLEVADLWERCTAAGSSQVWTHRLSSCIRRLREESGPLALVIDDATHEALEAFGVLLAMLVGNGLTVSINHPSPDPAQCRLSLGPEVAGFPVLSHPLPGPGDDPVARFVHERIRSEPELLQHPGGLTESVVERIELEEEPELIVVEELVELTEALREGARLDPRRIQQLVSLTLEGGDPGPWTLLAQRPEAERRAAVTSLLEHADEWVASRPMLDALLKIYPRGAPLAPLCAALLGWMRRADKPAVICQHLETALMEWPQDAARANRASLWTEAVRILVQTRHYREAAEAISGPVANRMVQEGAGTAVALMWTTLPASFRNPLRLIQITEALAKQPRGDEAAAMLFRSLDAETALEFSRNWVRHRGSEALQIEDAVLNVALDTPVLPIWLTAVRELRGSRAIRDALAAKVEDPADLRWVDIHAALSEEAMPVNALHLAGELPGVVALEPVARRLLAPALGELQFPDAQLAVAAARFASVDTGTLWAWVGIASGAPDSFPEEVVDATIIEVLSRPPSDQMLCEAVARRLGAAGQWSALDHARWVVRLALTPDPHDIAEAWLSAMMEGLVGRFDAAPHLAGLVGDMMQLESDHPALVGLLTRWLPAAWRGRIPAAFIEAVRVRGIPAAVMPLWERLLHAHR